MLFRWLSPLVEGARKRSQGDSTLKKYLVKLTQAQRQFLPDLIHAKQAATRMQVRARILLKADQGRHGPGWTDQQIIEALEVGHATVERTRKQFVEGGTASRSLPSPG